jgi:hypothetical protein
VIGASYQPHVSGGLNDEALTPLIVVVAEADAEPCE